MSAAEEYTPTDDLVREMYMLGRCKKVWGADIGTSLAEFDRWLAKHDAEVKAEALWEAASDIKDRIRAFRDLNADSQYDLALNDAWGLVANRARAAAKPTTSKES